MAALPGGADRGYEYGEDEDYGDDGGYLRVSGAEGDYAEDEEEGYNAGYADYNAEGDYEGPEDENEEEYGDEGGYLDVTPNAQVQEMWKELGEEPR